MTYLVRSNFQAHPFHLASHSPHSAWPISTTSIYLGLTARLSFGLLQTLLSRVYNSLEWGLNSPPKPHASTSLPIQSSNLYIVSNFTSLFCALILTIFGCITIYKLYLSQKILNVSNKTFFKCLFKNLINNPCLFLFKWLLFLIISFCVRTMVFYSLGMYEVELFTYLIIVFSTILPVLYTYHIVIQVINFICKPMTLAPFLLKNGVVYVPVYTHINLSINNKELHSSITMRNILLVLGFAVIGYYFSPLLYLISFYHYLSFSELESMPSSTCNTETEACTSSTSLVNYCKESSSTVLPNTGKAGSSTTPINSDSNSPTLDITYIQSRAGNRPYWAVIDKLDSSGTNLK